MTIKYFLTLVAFTEGLGERKDELDYSHHYEIKEVDDIEATLISEGKKMIIQPF